ncbi:hypothetical protein OE88DRAFT_1647649 [Heliocybe sulcata]|uniref:Uncharacterized protein n=1 Tax=Heliocybe sulcata TaxID=5364 RepID=A0A5C3MQ14_9AGAM|nr:hypothetical protein OE88DRAFT_1647649 [Heliocybe sulcata]
MPAKSDTVSCIREGLKHQVQATFSSDGRAMAHEVGQEQNNSSKTYSRRATFSVDLANPSSVSCVVSSIAFTPRFPLRQFQASTTSLVTSSAVIALLIFGLSMLATYST